MRSDRIIEPAEIAGIIRDYLHGSLDGMDAAVKALRLAGSSDRILAGHQTRIVVAAYWDLRRLAETGAGRPDAARLTFLLDCLEGRRRMPQDEASYWPGRR
jgi:hypothetical protein